MSREIYSTMSHMSKEKTYDSSKSITLIATSLSSSLSNLQVRKGVKDANQH